ncbi:hypothetical protein EZS27_019987 [termite gut metagenome]|uniref:Uncharacterized protein n=1 Tax=termite gut metagenome TaxID=433724 RepID=A0A5J4RD44_9ZZZZ
MYVMFGFLQFAYQSVYFGGAVRIYFHSVTLERESLINVSEKLNQATVFFRYFARILRQILRHGFL